ncbi:hypothetical protein C8D88_101913 [Lentzea atacamensis]|uniref:DM13 domain-containing protein n=1 Tax=Lentzea atacamensis TaxID=531938 RepID=A0A316IKK5_9PSEU|nr:hypothetical protein [Lentzea atacamensis]PWK90888.1 hypothetical protein C8D88_101913 [Lentzea atacamensis]RAS60436.1 hypothetical protein C8D87_112338 [Lentzea atacamensis]
MIIKKIAAGVLAATAVAVAAPAAAHADTDTGFALCDTRACDNNFVMGKITWHNRTATVSGHVVDSGPGFTVAKFRAYANGKQIGKEVSRYTDDASTNPDLKSPRALGFGLGDTNLPGGIDKIAIFLCFTETTCQYSMTVPKP